MWVGAWPRQCSGNGLLEEYTSELRGEGRRAVGLVGELLGRGYVLHSSLSFRGQKTPVFGKSQLA